MAPKCVMPCVKKLHGAFDPLAAQLAERLLRAVSDETRPQHQARQGKREVIRSRRQLAKHAVLLWNLRWRPQAIVEV